MRSVRVFKALDRRAGVDGGVQPVVLVEIVEKDERADGDEDQHPAHGLAQRRRLAPVDPFDPLIVDGLVFSDPRVLCEADNVRQRYQEDGDGREDYAAGLHHWNVLGAHGIEQQLANAGINEDDLDNHQPADQVHDGLGTGLSIIVGFLL